MSFIDTCSKKYALKPLLLICLFSLAGCGGSNPSSSDASSSASSTNHSTSTSSIDSSSSVSSVYIPEPQVQSYKNGDFVLGMDISYWSEQLDQGSVYLDTDGREKDLLSLFKNHGINMIRLRAFVDPSANYGYASGAGGCVAKAYPYNGTADVIRMAKRIKAAGMGLLLDFHYSDTWADPGKQVIPEAWRGAANADELASYVGRYTRDVLNQLKSENALPDMVQVGNETTPGMMIHTPTNNTDCWGNNGRVNGVNGQANDGNWPNLAKMLKAGIAAVKEVDANIQTVLHIENFDHPDGIEWWVRSAMANGVDFDILGLSAYEEFQGPASAWPVTMQRLANAFPSLSFAVVEYNQRARMLADVVRDVPNGRGVGTFFWEPTQSGFWGNAIFTQEGSRYRANGNDFAVYDQIVEDYGLTKLPE